VQTRQGIFVDNAWRSSSSDKTITVIDPATEQVFGSASHGSAEDVDVAVTSAHRALTQGPWPAMDLDERIAIVVRLGELVDARREELARLTSSSMGAPLRDTMTLYKAREVFDTYIDAARKLTTEFVRFDADGDTLIRKRPVGVVAGITPWNAPIRHELKKIVPAILAGCTIVLKPSPETPFGASVLAELCAEAGTPPGVVNLVLGGAEVGSALVNHPLVRKISFTGSSGVGVGIAQAAAADFRRLQLELGGKSAAIVLDDVDLDQVIPSLDAGIFWNAGQACVATSRVLVAQTRYQEVVDAMAEAARATVVGDPFDARTTMGPLVAKRQLDRVLGYIEKGRSEGAKLVQGGGTPSNLDRGWYVEPTVFADVDNSMTIAQEEIFGPVVSIIPFRDEDQAVALANDSSFGLGGAVHSADPLRALEVAKRVDSGYISVNQFGIGLSAPFGGVKKSGVGREHGIEGLDAFLEYVPHPIPHELAEQLAVSLPRG